MTTPRDLLIVTMDTAPDRPVEQGDLSLALAGAELIDLLAAGAVALDGDRIVPGTRPETADRLLGEAADALVREAPHESVEDWLWRRGRGLTEAYRAALEADGDLVRERHRGISFRAGKLAPADSPARRRAMDRWTVDEPVLVLLAEALGVRGKLARGSAGRGRRRRGDRTGRRQRRAGGTGFRTAAAGHRGRRLRQHLAGRRRMTPAAAMC